MKHRFSDGEPAYLRDRREAVARPGANLLAGILLSVAAVFGVAMIVPESGLSERAYAAQTAQTASLRQQTLCVKLQSSESGGVQLPFKFAS